MDFHAAQVLALTFEISHGWQILDHRMRLEESVELVLRSPPCALG
jgi:hypothetical protein